MVAFLLHYLWCVGYHKDPYWAPYSIYYLLVSGSTVCYVDDCTYSLGGKDPAALSEALSAQYLKIANYMAANKLVINADKTHLIVMGQKLLLQEEVKLL